MDYSKPPASFAPELASSSYIGTYTNSLYGDIQIIEERDGLRIVEGPTKVTFPMKHYNRDTFTYMPVGENAILEAGVTFSLRPDGKAATVLVENLDENGQGIFNRVAD
jgi:hypothetical protein